MGAPAPAAKRLGPSAALGPGALPRLGMGRVVGLAAAEACAGATAWPFGWGSPLGPEMGAVAVPTTGRMVGGCAANRARPGSAAWPGRRCWLAVGGAQLELANIQVQQQTGPADQVRRSHVLSYLCSAIHGQPGCSS